jgi:hypothetical protein
MASVSVMEMQYPSSYINDPTTARLSSSIGVTGASLLSSLPIPLSLQSMSSSQPHHNKGSNNMNLLMNGGSACAPFMTLQSPSPTQPILTFRSSSTRAPLPSTSQSSITTATSRPPASSLGTLPPSDDVVPSFASFTPPAPTTQVFSTLLPPASLIDAPTPYPPMTLMDNLQSTTTTSPLNEVTSSCSLSSLSVNSNNNNASSSSSLLVSSTTTPSIVSSNVAGASLSLQCPIELSPLAGYRSSSTISAKSSSSSKHLSSSSSSSSSNSNGNSNGATKHERGRAVVIGMAFVTEEESILMTAGQKSQTSAAAVRDRARLLQLQEDGFDIIVRNGGSLLRVGIVLYLLMCIWMCGK